jgi:rRNA maturation protein Nop10
MPRGQKKCDNCGELTGPRAHNCPNCGHKFTFNPKKYSPNKVVKEPFDWRNLKKGEFIKSIGGHGPFYPTTNHETGEKEIVPMGHYGIFKVEFVDNQGIGAYEVHKNHQSGGFCYLYMGKPKLSKVTDTVMRPHKIKKVIRRVKT